MTCECVPLPSSSQNTKPYLIQCVPGKLCVLLPCTRPLQLYHSSQHCRYNVYQPIKVHPKGCVHIYVCVCISSRPWELMKYGSLSCFHKIIITLSRVWSSIVLVNKFSLSVDYGFVHGSTICVDLV